jgi:indole-3-glycerol phosphate synthase
VLIRPPDLLEAIVGATRHIVAGRQARESQSVLERRALERTARGDRFRAAIADTNRHNIIAECKRRSPSRGVLRRAYDPVAIAASYERGGAVALSILTEPTFFDGALEHLNAVRLATELPLLRKDFIVDEYQLLEARAYGADAVLLIVAALSQSELRKLHHLAARLGLAALVEVHDADELDRAMEAGAEIVGVNNRNLRTLEVDTEVSRVIAARLRANVIAVSESGLRSSDDLVHLRSLGYRAFLIGETLMSAADPEAALRSILGTVTGTGFPGPSDAEGSRVTALPGLRPIDLP